MQLTKPLVFLNSVERNSVSSKNAYSCGLFHLNNFILRKYSNYNCETILQPLLKNKINVYEFIEGFVSYLLETRIGMAPKSILLYVTAIRSYFAYYDIDVIPSKFRRKVRLPKVQREDEEPLDVSDIRKILLSCNNRRLKTLILVIASGGMRVGEALAIRNKDLDLSVSPTKVHIRKEYLKPELQERSIFQQKQLSTLNNGSIGSIRILIERENIVKKIWYSRFTKAIILLVYT